MGDALPAVDLGTGRSATSLALGFTHSCALLDDAGVKCWGENTYGQLGQGDEASRGDELGEMGDSLPAVDLGTGRTATTIGAHLYATCAVLDDGTLECWGDNTYGELGQGDTADRGDASGEMGDALPPIALGSGRTVSVIALGDHHVCAGLDDGTVKCWGLGGFGQLGLGDQETRGDGPGEMGDALPALDLVRPPTTCAGLEVTVDLGQEQAPTAAADVILGTPEADVIRGLGGDDVVCGLGGGDTIGGGGGKDRIFGGGGDDSLRAGPGGGLLAGNAGADTLRGDKGNDTLRGGADDDVITGGAGNDVADGGAGDNTCSLAPGRDRAVNC
jgi:Ca2+-binding RTX toxin-like protein